MDRPPLGTNLKKDRDAIAVDVKTVYDQYNADLAKVNGTRANLSGAKEVLDKIKSEKNKLAANTAKPAQLRRVEAKLAKRMTRH